MKITGKGWQPQDGSAPENGLFFVVFNLLGAVFVAIALCTDTLYVLTASSLTGFVKRRSRWLPFGRYLSAATFISLGVYAALATPRPGR